jgi:hypothetical protein
VEIKMNVVKRKGPGRRAFEISELFKKKYPQYPERGMVVQCSPKAGSISKVSVNTKAGRREFAVDDNGNIIGKQYDTKSKRRS